MRSYRSVLLLILLSTVAVLTRFALADRLILKNGKVLEGRVIRQEDGYWIKTKDGPTLTFSDAEVGSVETSSAKPTPADVEPKAPADAGTRSPGAALAGGSTAAAGSSSLAAVKRKADAVDLPLSALTMWQQYIETKPAAGDLKIAKEEQAKWQKLFNEGAERVKDRWVSGEEVRALRTKVDAIAAEFQESLRANQTLKAVKKLEEAQSIYPNDYKVNFWLGYVMMLQHQDDKAIPFFEQSLRLCPKLGAASADLGLIYVNKRRLADAVLKMEESAEDGDSPEIARNLITALSELTEGQRRAPRMKGAMAAANLLALKYPNIAHERVYTLIALKEPEKFKPKAGMPAKPGKPGSHAEDDPDADEPGDEPKDEPSMAGGMWSGTGFLITADGLILTNRHVVDGSKTLMVVLDKGVQKAGEIVMIDDQQDLALVRIKSDGPTPFLKFITEDTPADGADCTVMGYPLYGRLGTHIKVTRGVVTGIEGGELGANVLVDAKVNPGNSGGPMLDRHGNVMAIVAMKTLSTRTEDTYGLGLSAGHIRKFLAKNRVAATNGADKTVMSAEEIAAKVKPAAVCLLSTR